jgi:hypothetical protein
LPDLLGDEGHEGVRQPQQRLQRATRVWRVPRLAASDAVSPVSTGLAQLQVPVAELAPGELVDGLGGEVEAVAVEGVAHVAVVALSLAVIQRSAALSSTSPPMPSPSVPGPPPSASVFIST